MADAADPFALSRFVAAQDAGGAYDVACDELRRGRKRGHWIWFVFPQLRGLGRSAMAQRYGISGLAEAHAYHAHPVLGPRLADATRLVLALPADADLRDVLGDIDAIKLRSSMTLFDAVAPPPSPYADVLARRFDGVRDPMTRSLLRERDASR